MYNVCNTAFETLRKYIFDLSVSVQNTYYYLLFPKHQFYVIFFTIFDEDFLENIISKLLCDYFENIVELFLTYSVFKYLKLF